MFFKFTIPIFYSYMDDMMEGAHAAHLAFNSTHHSHLATLAASSNDTNMDLRGLCLPRARDNTSEALASTSCLPDGSSADVVSVGVASSDYQFLFITGQLLHGIGAAALTTLGTTLVDESVSKVDAPMYIGIFEASFVFGPALG